MGKSFYIKTEVTILEGFKKIIQSGNYEKLILEIMNCSKKVFPNEYIHNENQPNGECDFIDVVTEEKYDAKLPFDKKQGQLIGSRKGDYIQWLEIMRDESLEFGNVAKNRGKVKVEDLVLYKIIRDRLASIEDDENLILFFPFPIVDCDAPNSVLLQFASNILTVIFGALEKNGLVKERKIFAIYPCMENHLAIRFLNKRRCEYVSDEPLKKYIDYNISLDLH